MKYIEVGNFRRITKRKARDYFAAGGVVRLLPCNIAPGTLWLGDGLPITKRCGEDDASFDRYVNAFTFHNCNHEVGYYPAFYVENKRR